MRPSIHLEAKHLVRPVRTESVLAVLQALGDLDLEQPAAERIHIDPSRARRALALLREEDLAMAVLHLESIELQFLRRQLVRLENKARTGEGRLHGGTRAGDHIGEVFFALL